MNRYQHTQNVELRASTGESGNVIEGYAIVFDSDSLPMGTEKGKTVYERIAPEAISRELLDRSTIALTLEHDYNRFLARSKNGQGSLTYDIDDHGVKFRAALPNTSTGAEAVELVRRGDIDGCSFMFACRYGNRDAVTRSEADDRVTYTIRKIERVMDFTLTFFPAYDNTECQLRSEAYGIELPDNGAAEQIAEMRREIENN